VRFRPTSIQILILALAPGAVTAQEPESGLREAYFRAVGEHFEIPFQEVTIIGEWELTPDEVPVVLFLAGRAGVTPDALIGSRRSGRPWREVARRFGVGPQAFHLPLPENIRLGTLARAYEEFRARPASEWFEIQLEDPDIIALVNLRVLGEQTRVLPGRILSAREEAGSFMRAYPLLIRR
jgi:hypothetical protein